MWRHATQQQRMQPAAALTIYIYIPIIIIIVIVCAENRARRFYILIQVESFISLLSSPPAHVYTDLDIACLSFSI